MAPDVQMFRGPKPPTPPQKGSAPVAPKTVANAPAAPPVEANETVTIRTMKDDVAALAAKKPSVAAAPQVIKDAVPSTSTAFPLPIKPDTGKSVIMPTQKSKKRRPGRMIGVVIAALVLVSGGGAAWYFLRGNTAQPVNEAVINNPQELVPGNALSVTEYRFDTEERKQAINDFLAKQRGELVAGQENILQGDPRQLLSQDGLTNLLYVTMPQETQPYLIVKQTKQTQALFASASSSNVTTVGGWYIAHQTPIDSYINALNQGNLATQNVIQAFSEPYAIRIYLAQEALNALAGQMTQGQVKKSSLSHATVISDLPSGNILSLKGTGAHQAAETGTINSPDTTILYLVPPSVQFLRIGYNFAADVQSWSGLTESLADSTILQEPAVSQLISQLSQSYAYYQRPGSSAAAASDFGFIIRLSPELKSSLGIGDPTLERGLFALAPLVTGTKQGTPLTFNDANFEGIPLRYVNLTGPTGALDYAISGDYLLIATSKDGMAALLGAVKNPTAPTTGVTQAVNSVAGGSASQSIAGTILNETSLQYLIPGLKSHPTGAVGIKAIEGLNRSIEAKIIFTAP